MLFKDISYLELWWPFCSAARNNLCLCNFGRGYPEEQFCKSYFEFGPVVQEDLVGFVALRPKSTAMVIAGRSVHLTTLFPGQA